MTWNLSSVVGVEPPPPVLRALELVVQGGGLSAAGRTN